MGFDIDNGSGTSRGKIYAVEQLDAETIREVAERVAGSSAFEDLIYRESEIDALWSLADIAARKAALDQAPAAGHWAEVRDRIGRAHDLVPEGECLDAAAVLQETAGLL